MTGPGPAPSVVDRSFTVRLPPSWFEIDLWRATRTGQLARALDRRIDDTPELGRHRGAILRFLRDVAADAERRNMVFAAAVAEPLDGRELLVATAAVLVTPGPAGVDGIQSGVPDVGAIASRITAVSPDRNERGVELWRRVELTDVRAGRAVRVTAIEDVRWTDGRSVPCVTMHTLIPVPGESQVLDLVLSSPHAGLSGPLLDLFDAISASLEWTDDGVDDGADGGTVAATTERTTD